MGPKLTLVPQWQPVETAPKNGEQFLCFVELTSADAINAFNEVMILRWYADKEEWDLSPRVPDTTIDSPLEGWLPLPDMADLQPISTAPRDWWDFILAYGDVYLPNEQPYHGWFVAHWGVDHNGPNVDATVEEWQLLGCIAGASIKRIEGWVPVPSWPNEQVDWRRAYRPNGQRWPEPANHTVN